MSDLHIIYGDGKGKTSCAVGMAIKAAGGGKQVIIVQFLKGKETADYNLLQRLEPEIKILSFERSDKYYCELTPEEQEEQRGNIKNGLNYSKKVVDTGECDVLILDEMLGLFELGILTVEEVVNILQGGSDELQVIMTGRTLPDQIKTIANEVTEMSKR